MIALRHVEDDIRQAQEAREWNFERVAVEFIKAFVASWFVHYVCDYIAFYDVITFCLHGLLLTSFYYRISLDKNGCILILMLLLLPILTVFNFRPSLLMVIISAFTSGINATFIRPIFDMYKQLMFKPVFDIMAFNAMANMGLQDGVRQVADTFFVLSCIYHDVTFSMRFSRSRRIDTICHTIIYIGHICVFYFGPPTFRHFFALLLFNLIWMSVNADMVERRFNVLAMDID